MVDSPSHSYGTERKSNRYNSFNAPVYSYKTTRKNSPEDLQYTLNRPVEYSPDQLYNYSPDRSLKLTKSKSPDYEKYKTITKKYGNNKEDWPFEGGPSPRMIEIYDLYKDRDEFVHPHVKEILEHMEYIHRMLEEKNKPISKEDAMKDLIDDYINSGLSKNAAEWEAQKDLRDYIGKLMERNLEEITSLEEELHELSMELKEYESIHLNESESRKIKKNPFLIKKSKYGNTYYDRPFDDFLTERDIGRTLRDMRQKNIKSKFTNESDIGKKENLFDYDSSKICGENETEVAIFYGVNKDFSEKMTYDSYTGDNQDPLEISENNRDDIYGIHICHRGKILSIFSPYHDSISTSSKFFNIRKFKYIHVVRSLTSGENRVKKIMDYLISGKAYIKIRINEDTHLRVYILEGENDMILRFHLIMNDNVYEVGFIDLNDFDRLENLLGIEQRNFLGFLMTELATALNPYADKREISHLNSRPRTNIKVILPTSFDDDPDSRIF